MMALVAVALACNSEKKADRSIDSATVAIAERLDSLSFKYDSVKVYSKNRVSSDPRVTDTAKAVISYPVFSDKAVNEFVAKKILATAGDVKYNSYQTYASEFIKGFDDFQKANKDRIQTWFLNINSKVIRQQDTYISFYTTYINFSGGAHPNSMFLYQNFNPVTNQEIVLDSLLLPGSRTKLQAIAEKIFRTNEKLGPAESLKGKYFFENDTFSLNENFTITGDGLLFLYNPYEIKAYAFGITKLLIPFNDLKEIARPNSLLKPN